MRIPHIFNQEVPALNKIYELGDTVMKPGNDIGSFMYGVVARFFTVNGKKWIEFDTRNGERGAVEPAGEWVLATEDYVRSFINSRPFDYLYCMTDRVECLDEALYRFENKKERDVQNFMYQVRENKKEFLRKQEENMKKKEDIFGIGQPLFVLGKEEKPKVITMCGSTKFKDEYIREYRRLVFEGNVVIPSLIFAQTDDEVLSKEQLQLLADLHRRKIDISDAIFVVNPGNYIGRSTIYEIFYAHDHNKEVIYLE